MVCTEEQMSKLPTYLNLEKYIQSKNNFYAVNIDFFT